MQKATTHPHQDGGLVLDRQHLPYQLDEGIGYRARIGLIVLATDQTIEYEFRRMLPLPGVALYESRLANTATITPETLQVMEHDIPKAAAFRASNRPSMKMAESWSGPARPTLPCRSRSEGRTLRRHRAVPRHGDDVLAPSGGGRPGAGGGNA